MILTTTEGHKVRVDDEDAELLQKFTWSEKTYQGKGTGKYISNEGVYMHRLLMGVPEDAHLIVVCHRVRNPLDNRKANLKVMWRQSNGAAWVELSPFIHYDAKTSTWGGEIITPKKIINFRSFETKGAVQTAITKAYSNWTNVKDLSITYYPSSITMNLSQ